MGVRVAADLTILRNLSGVSPHVWTNNVESFGELLQVARQVVTHGGIANLDVPETRIGALATGAAGAAHTFAQVMALNDAVSEVFDRAELTDYIAIHLSEETRNARSLLDGWTQVTGPTLSAFGHLMAAGLPARLIDDQILAEGDLLEFRFVLSATVEALPKGEEEGPELIRSPALPIDPGTAAQVFSSALAPVLAARSSAPTSLILLQDAVEARV